MDREKKCDVFLSLVRLGVGNSNIEPNYVDINWEQLKALAEKHGLMAVVWDGIEQLPLLAVALPTAMKLEWIGTVMHNYEGRYVQYEKAIADLAEWYNSHGLKMMVLKGFACSLDWPNPEHRPCGDIDIWMFGEQRKADALLAAEKNIKVEVGEPHHTVFYWNNMMVENHYDFLNVNHHKSNKEYESILKDLGQDKSHYMEVQGQRIYLPSSTLHALYLLRHSAGHFASVGIVLRHLLDWGFFIRAHACEIDWENVEVIIERFGMKRLYDVFNAICVVDLGFDAKFFPKVCCDPEIKDRVLYDILDSEFVGECPKNIVRRIIFKYKRWKGNEWKHRLCYNDSMWSAFWCGVWNHLRKPATI